MVWVLGVESHLHGVTLQGDLRLIQRQGLALGDAQLPFHQVQPGNGLGHRMLHLQPGIHFHEEEITALVQQEFHSACAYIADRQGRPHCGLAHGLAQWLTQAGGGRLFEYLLVAALDRAVPFVQVEAVALAVGKHLDLHMARSGQVFLQQQAIVTKGRLGLAPGRLQGRGQFGLALYYLHSLTAAPSTGLEQCGITDLPRGLDKGLRRLVRTVIARHQRYPSLGHQRFGSGLVTHGLDGGGGWANQHQARRADSPSEGGVFREKAITRMNRLGAAGECGLDDAVDVQVAFAGPDTAQVHRTVGLMNVQGIPVHRAVHGHGSDAHGAGGAHDAAGDFAPVGHQQRGDHQFIPRSSWGYVFPGRRGCLPGPLHWRGSAQCSAGCNGAAPGKVGGRWPHAPGPCWHAWPGGCSAVG